MEAVRDLDQLGGDPQPFAVAPDAAFDDVGDSEAASDLPQILVAALEVEGGGASGDLQARNLSQAVDQLFGEPVSEESGIRAVAEIRERQHGDRRDGRRRRLGAVGLTAPADHAGELHCAQPHDRQHPGQDGAVDPPKFHRRRVRGPIRGHPDVAIRPPLEGPGQDQGDRQAEHQHDQGQSGSPFRQGEGLEYGLGDLEQAPRRDGVDSAHADDVAPLQLAEETPQHRTPPRSPSAPTRIGAACLEQCRSIARPGASRQVSWRQTAFSRPSGGPQRPCGIRKRASWAPRGRRKIEATLTSLLNARLTMHPENTA